MKKSLSFLLALFLSLHALPALAVDVVTGDTGFVQPLHNEIGFLDDTDPFRAMAIVDLAAEQPLANGDLVEADFSCGVLNPNDNRFTTNLGNNATRGDTAFEYTKVASFGSFIALSDEPLLDVSAIITNPYSDPASVMISPNTATNIPFLVHHGVVQQHGHKIVDDVDKRYAIAVIYADKNASMSHMTPEYAAGQCRMTYRITRGAVSDGRSGNGDDLFPQEFVAATGGTVTTDGDYTVHTFTTSGTLVVSAGGDVEYLIVGAGGGGGGNTSGSAGGAGAGQVRAGTTTVTPGNYTVTIGAGGVGGANASTSGSNGGNTVFGGLTSLGGGGGARQGSFAGLAGGNGGGGSAVNGAGGSGTTGGFAGGQGQGNVTPYRGGGGAGAGAAGASGAVSGEGGTGVTSSITGTSLMYAAGGGAGNHGPSGGAVIAGGGAGAGDGAATGPGGDCVGNTGSGGGGGGQGAGAGGDGCPGVVVVRYPSQ